MLLKQGRTCARTADEAIEKIMQLYPAFRKINIRECNVQPKKDLIWYEYVIQLKEGDSLNDFIQ